MPIYKLTPNKDRLDDEAWQSSSNRKICHVSAKTEMEARQYAAEKFLLGGQVATSNPWLDARLTDSLLEEEVASEPMPLGEVMILE